MTTYIALFVGIVSDIDGVGDFNNFSLFVFSLVAQRWSGDNLLWLIGIVPVLMWSIIWDIVIWSITVNMWWAPVVGSVIAAIFKVVSIVFIVMIYNSSGGSFSPKELLSQVAPRTGDSNYSAFGEESQPGDRQEGFDGSSYNAPEGYQSEI